MTDADRPELPPVPGEPPNVPNPEFPAEKRAPEPVNPEPEQVQYPGHEPAPQRVMGDNELGDRLDRLRQRWQYGGKVALESRIEAAKLLKNKYDADPKFRGERYEKFAFMHGCATNSTDANNMYVLGEFGDAYRLQYEAEARVKLSFDWPGWRAVVTQIKREQKKRGTAESEQEVAESDDGRDDTTPPDPVGDLERERDNLTAQVGAATQQFRNERAKREEVEEKLNSTVSQLRAEIATLHQQLAARDGEIASLKEWQNDPPLTGRTAILQTIASLVRGRFHRVRVTGTSDALEINGRADPQTGLCVIAVLPPHAHVQGDFNIESVEGTERQQITRLLAGSGVTIPRGRVLFREYPPRENEKLKLNAGAEWALTVQTEAKNELLAACQRALNTNKGQVWGYGRARIGIHEVDGKLSFQQSPNEFDISALLWLLRKPWTSLSLCQEGLIRVIIPSSLGDCAFYCRAFETRIAQTGEIARIAEQVDEYWYDDERPSNSAPQPGMTWPIVVDDQDDIAEPLLPPNPQPIFDGRVVQPRVIYDHENMGDPLPPPSPKGHSGLDERPDSTMTDLRSDRAEELFSLPRFSGRPAEKRRMARSIRASIFIRCKYAKIVAPTHILHQKPPWFRERAHRTVRQIISDEAPPSPKSSDSTPISSTVPSADTSDDQPKPCTDLDAVCQDVARLLAGRVRRARITGSEVGLAIHAYDDDKMVFVQAHWPMQPEIQNEFNIELRPSHQLSNLDEGSRNPPKRDDRVPLRELPSRMIEPFKIISDIAWEITVGPEKKADFVAACNRAKKDELNSDKVFVTTEDGKLDFPRGRIDAPGYRRIDLQWVLRKPWNLIRLCPREAVMGAIVPGLLGEYEIYLRGV
jgi:hypothetical protein